MLLLQLVFQHKAGCRRLLFLVLQVYLLIFEELSMFRVFQQKTEALPQLVES